MTVSQKLASALAALLTVGMLAVPAARAADVPSRIQAMLDGFETTLQQQIGETPDNGQGKRIGVLIISLTNPFWANMKDCYENAAKTLNTTVDVQTGTTEGDTRSQLDTLMTMADMKYDAIIVSPIDGTNLIPGILKCNKNGTPVLNLGPGVDLAALEAAGGHLDGKITVSFEEQGETAAKDLIARLPGGGEVAILEGLPGAGQSRGRTAGATRGFQAVEGVALVASQPCAWDASKAYDATKDILHSHPKLAGIFACNDVMALAAVEALNAAGRSDVLVYGVDFTDDARASMKAGKLTGSMSYSSALYTKAALRMALHLARGGKYDGNVYLPLTLITRDTVHDFDGWK